MTNEEPVAQLSEETPTLILTGKLYDTLKLVALVLLPALSTVYFGLGNIWGWPNIEQVIGSIAVIDTALGTLIGVSSKRYNNSDVRFDGVIVSEHDGGGLQSASLELKGDPETILTTQEEVRFKVLPPNVT